MNRLKQARYEFVQIEQESQYNRWMNRLHPLIKFLLTIFYIVLVVSYPRYDIFGLLGMILYPIVLFMIGEIPFLKCIKRQKAAFFLILAVGIWNPLFDRTVLAEVGTVQITGGMISMLTLMLKGMFSVLVVYLFVVTTSIEKICYAMRLLHIPKVIVTVILLIYRYLTLLLSEAQQMMEAYALRAPKQKGLHYKVWGSLIGQFLLRSIDRASEVYESMCLRGYCGEFEYEKEEKIQCRDWIYFVFWVVALILLKAVPIFKLL